MAENAELIKVKKFYNRLVAVLVLALTISVTMLIVKASTEADQTALDTSNRDQFVHAVHQAAATAETDEDVPRSPFEAEIVSKIRCIESQIASVEDPE